MKIMIRMPNWLGDLVMATPMIEETHKKWPHASIFTLCQAAHAEMLAGHPYIEKNLIYTPAALKGLHFDLGLLLPNSFSSAWQFFRARIPERIGFASDWRRWLLTHPIAIPAERGKEHLVDTYKRLLGVPFSDSKPLLYVKTEEKKTARAFLKKLGIPKEAKIIGIHATAAYGSAKCWLPERFHELVTRFPEAYCLFFAEASSQPLIDYICRGLPASAINLAGKTSLRELMALLTCCSALVTNDSGPMHMAAALHIPLISLFGSTNPVATGPYKHGIVLYKKAPCAPCYRRICPIDFRCMKAITVDEVAEQLRYLL